jgi:G:T-mismatch repair DNA endonuclease (very short patch repair protein)
MKCFREKQQIESNPPELIEFIKQNFTNNGGKWISEHTGYSVGIVRRIAYRIGLIVSQKGKRQQYEAAKKRMTQNNPMFKQETRAKVAKYWENHPEERALVLEKLMEGHQRIQKSKPNKLELKLFGYLDQLGLEYEPYHLIKPKFIVDALVGDNIIVQADGDYWHGHPRFSKLTERQIAQQKRDKAQDAYLTKCGYKVIRIWENDMSIDVVRNRLKL